MHEIQKTILARLVNKNGQKYSNLTRGYDFEDNIVFHLKQLSKEALIEKSQDKYKITPKGLREIYSLGLPDLDFPRKKLFFCGLVITDGAGNFLIKEHPMAKVNFYNLPSGDPRFGEKIEESLVRIFEKNTDLKVTSDKFSFVSLHLKITKTPAGEVLFDDGQAIYKIEVSMGEKEKMKLDDGVVWSSQKQIKEMENCWPEVKMCILDKTILPYASYEVISDYKL
ncbi:hypothetical protein KBC75_00220 [Candidatus Shapirobacteria bacterium]|nr:hypothetical protein [Candidatus Shapirobacteria bacterium]